MASGAPDWTISVELPKDAVDYSRVIVSDGTNDVLMSSQNSLRVLPRSASEGWPMVYHRGSATNTTTTIYTVPAGKSFYLIAAGLNYYATTGNTVCYMHITSNSNLLAYAKSHIAGTYSTTDSDTVMFNPPTTIPMAQGATIQVYSGGAGLVATGWIMGWEE